MRIKHPIALLAITTMAVLSACSLDVDNPLSKDNEKGDAVDLPVGCRGYVDAEGTTRWDQIPGEPTCVLTTTVTPDDQPATPASPNDGATPTASPTEAPQATPTGQQCRLEKDGTWSEGNNSHRIEVAGHGVRHNDFYPMVGVKSVSYIVGEILPSEISPIWWGYGSQWSGDSPECADFDWFADASAYASARVDSGHSGLVVDLRYGEMTVVYNALNLDQNAIDALLAVHMASMQG